MEMGVPPVKKKPTTNERKNIFFSKVKTELAANQSHQRETKYHKSTRTSRLLQCQAR
jgi:hypothetical protein